MSFAEKGAGLLCDIRPFPVDLTVSRKMPLPHRYIQRVPVTGAISSTIHFPCALCPLYQQLGNRGTREPGREVFKELPFLPLFYQLVTA